MLENPRRGWLERNFRTNVPKILDLKSSSEQIFSENWRWVPLLWSVIMIMIMIMIMIIINIILLIVGQSFISCYLA